VIGTLQWLTVADAPGTHTALHSSASGNARKSSFLPPDTLIDVAINTHLAATPNLPLPRYRRAVARLDLDSQRSRAILARICAIPEGFVRTYGDLSPGAPRVAGAVLSVCEDPSVPWHRVVRADGSLAKGARQRSLLDAEGVPFRGARVDLDVARVPNL
jgi:methylated-DNA-protein-cysteine methyltransferase related protein